MRSGEWTQSMALAMSAAVGVLTITGGTYPSEVIKYFRGITPSPQHVSRKLGLKTHEEYFQLTFESIGDVVFPVIIEVALLCEDCNLHTHNWGTSLPNCYMFLQISKYLQRYYWNRNYYMNQQVIEEQITTTEVSSPLQAMRATKQALNPQVKTEHTQKVFEKRKRFFVLTKSFGIS